MVFEFRHGRDEEPIGERRRPVQEVTGQRGQAEGFPQLRRLLLGATEDHLTHRGVEHPVAQPSQRRAGRRQPRAEWRGVDAGQRHRGDGEHDQRDLPPLGEQRAGDEGVLGRDHVRPEVPNDRFERADVLGHRPQEHLPDVPAQVLQAELGRRRPFGAALLVDLGVIEVERLGTGHERRATAGDQPRVLLAGVPEHLVPGVDQFPGDRQPGPDVAGERHGREQDPGQRISSKSGSG